MKWLSFFLILQLLVCCTPPEPNGAVVSVEYAGALKDMMKKGDISAKFDLASLQGEPNVYGLGAIAELKGEILIWNSTPLLASVKHDTLLIESNYDQSATLLVYAQVADWMAIDIPAELKTESALEAFVEAQAQVQGLSTETPFPFLLRGTVDSFDWHVIDWKTGDTEHTHEKHISSGLNGKLTDVEVEILGFFSKHHHAVFTHHTTNMHMHVRTADGKLVGHLDDLELGAGMKLFLPKLEEEEL